MNGLFIEAILRDTNADRVRYQSYRAFILLWLLFEAWLTDLSHASTTRAKIDWFKNNPNYFEDSWKDILVQGQINHIASHCPIYDNRFNPPRNPVTISNPLNADLYEVVEVLYRIRSNLIHGHENITKNENVNLYSACGDILHKWLTWTYHLASKKGLIY